MGEGNETPGNGPPGEGADRDVLAARRARRTELIDPALTRRAEAAEATVRTLEAHLANLQQRLGEAEREQERLTESLQAREHEVRRVKQREYAEQQLRVEAEDSREHIQREHRTEVDRMRRRLAAAERHSQALVDSLESSRRELAEAEQTAGAERAALSRAERDLSAREQELARQELALLGTREELESRLEEARAAHQQAEMSRATSDEQRELLTQRIVALEARAAELQRELELERIARATAELTLARLQDTHVGLGSIVDELKRTTQELNEALVRERLRARREAEHQRSRLVEEHARELEGLRRRIRALEGELASAAQPEREEARREEMAGALAAAVDRLRARVAAVGELQIAHQQASQELPGEASEETSSPVTVALHGTETLDPDPDLDLVDPPAELDPPDPVHESSAAKAERVVEAAELAPQAADLAPQAPELVPLTQRVISTPEQRTSWLAPALRRVAERHDPKLAGELISELLPAQGLVLEGPLAYRAKIEELGTFDLRIERGRTTLERSEADPLRKVDFTLEGPASAFSELAGGGAGRKLAGLRVRGSRRRARRVLAARRAPFALADLARAGISLWPGLVLLALTEAIDPAWTVGHRFVVAFAIEGHADVTLYLRVCDGEPIVVTPACGEQPQSTAHVSEQAFLGLISGVPLPEGRGALLEGDPQPLELLIDWADRAQGLRRLDA
jgi:hypothetical protein